MKTGLLAALFAGGLVAIGSSVSAPVNAAPAAGSLGSANQETLVEKVQRRGGGGFRGSGGGGMRSFGGGGGGMRSFGGGGGTRAFRGGGSRSFGAVRGPRGGVVMRGPRGTYAFRRGGRFAGPAFRRGRVAGVRRFHRGRWWGPGVVIGAPWYGYRGCDWLRRRAIATGSPYWWRRYRRCL